MSHASAINFGLVACSKAKRPGGPWPARDLYIGQLFRNARAYCESRFGDGWAILSARHGLLMPDRVIEAYDETLADMGRDDRIRWAVKVNLQLHDLRAERGANGLPTYFHVFAGNLYCDPLPDLPIPFCDHPHTRPLQGLGIGEQLQALKQGHELINFYKHGGPEQEPTL